MIPLLQFLYFPFRLLKFHLIALDLVAVALARRAHRSADLAFDVARESCQLVTEDAGGVDD